MAPLKVPKITFGESSLRPDAPSFVPQRAQQLISHGSSNRDGPIHQTAASLKRGPPPETDEEAAKRLKLTVLAPFFDRIRHDGEENLRLRQMNAKLANMNKRQRMQLAGMGDNQDDETGQLLLLESPDSRGTKRKAPPISPMRIGSREAGDNDHTTDGHLIQLARQICKDLEETVANETIHFCGLGPIKIMESRPDDVLALAHQKLHTWPYKSVPMCWRRLYEDATLSKVASMLYDEAERIGEAVSFKRRRLNGKTPSHGDMNMAELTVALVVESLNADQMSPEWLTDLVTTLDKGITLSGAPGRASVFEGVFQQLDNYLKDEASKDIPTTMNIQRRRNFGTEHPVARSSKAMNFEAFQLYLNQAATPIIIPGILVTWPAISLWQNPTYLMRVTLGGRRLVPVEVGKSYLDDEWSQKMMPFREFMTDFLLPKEPKEVGYLAQHDLFAQIPALKNDITIPDYCYTTPPDPDGAASRTAGLASARRLDEPLLNAWLGPKGTKTPLHTDPYHNILCQVVGYKYARLYAPTETPNVYPCGVDDNGIDMSNTSQVDVSYFRTRALDASTDVDAQREEHLKYPLFKNAKFVEAILGPGESLYIPLGWWHYVESLSTSFSVSFWWN